MSKKNNESINQSMNLRTTYFSVHYKFPVFGWKRDRFCRQGWWPRTWRCQWTLSARLPLKRHFESGNLALPPRLWLLAWDPLSVWTLSELVLPWELIEASMWRLMLPSTLSLLPRFWESLLRLRNLAFWFLANRYSPFDYVLFVQLTRTLLCFPSVTWLSVLI